MFRAQPRVHDRQGALIGRFGAREIRQIEIDGRELDKNRGDLTVGGAARPLHEPERAFEQPLCFPGPLEIEELGRGRSQQSYFVQRALGLRCRLAADDVDSVGAGLRCPRRSLNRNRVHRHRVGDDVDLLVAPSPGLVLKIGQRAAVGASQMRDEIDAALLDDNAHPFAGSDCDLIPVIVAAKQAPFDRLVRLQTDDVGQLAGRKRPGCRGGSVWRRDGCNQRRRSDDEDA
jgi:hypothetical protein